MFLGYNTNGLAHHRLTDAIGLLAELGYRGVGITIDHYALSPWADNLSRELRAVRRTLEGHEMRSVIETGARFLLDPRTKHEPTLMTAELEDRRRRIEFYWHAVRCAAELQSDCVSIWSGVLREATSRAEAMRRLADGLNTVLDEGRRQGVTIAFEPEPGMFIDTLAAYDELCAQLGRPLPLTIDVGHLHCQGETPIADQIARRAARLVNVHLDDARAGVHEHLMFGEGEIDFPPVIEALRNIGYAGGLYVELSRHSHVGPAVAGQSLAFLRPMMKDAD